MPRRPVRPPVDRSLSCMIRLDGREYCLDPVGGVTDTLGKKWTLPLMGVLGNRPGNRFNELVEALDGVGGKALSGRLHDLERLGLVRRELVPGSPGRALYRLTDRGVELRRALVPLLQWAAADSAADRKATAHP
ncbi:MAG: helix-turn-helix transcriptional regulator [Thermoplasmata archaeon]|nr:helix-turn-helix transcriptional regulator [Thermoplasmata archaeon]MCI4356634.1 helix-turn-helix transcriptional regulator [Thermoplasmata archaeon]